MISNDIGKIPPHSIEIETALLGAIIQYKDAYIQVQSLISEESFYKQENQIIFNSLKRLKGKDIIPDFLQVVEDLKRTGELEQVTVPYLAKLNTNYCLLSQIESYAMILKEKELSRKHIALGYEIIRRAFDEGADPIENNDFIVNSLSDLSNLITLSKEETNVEIISKVINQLELAESTQGLTGVPSCIKEVDRVTGGWQDDDLIIIAARPGMGKTALALSMAKNAKETSNVAIFSLEMGNTSLMKRLISNDANIEMDKFKSGSMTEFDWKQFHESAGRMENDNLIIIDDIFELNSIISKSKVLHAKHGLDMVIVDYLQLVGNKANKGNREQEISSISRGLKMLAKSLGVPVIALSQLSRSVETRGGDKRPILSDLRESGAIEQDADIVSFVYRPSYYGLTEDEQGNSTKGIGELIIAKNRSGSLANLRLSFKGDFQRFSSLENEYEPLEPNMDF